MGFDEGFPHRPIFSGKSVNKAVGFDRRSRLIFLGLIQELVKKWCGSGELFIERAPDVVPRKHADGKNGGGEFQVDPTALSLVD